LDLIVCTLHCGVSTPIYHVGGLDTWKLTGSKMPKSDYYKDIKASWKLIYCFLWFELGEIVDLYL